MGVYETWTIEYANSGRDRKRLAAFEIWGYRKLLKIG